MFKEIILSWNDGKSAANDFNGLARRSNLLGADRSICNFGGGNTSTKLSLNDRFGSACRVLAVKASGSDLATIQPKQFGLIRMGRLEEMAALGIGNCADELMVDMLLEGTFDRHRPNPSIETTLHGFIPAKHVDHTHPDAVIALACTSNWEEHARNIYGKKWVAAPFIRPGYDLSVQISTALKANSDAEIVIMQSHGAITWHEGSSEECFENTVRLLNLANEYVRTAVEKNEPLGDISVPAMDPDAREELQLKIAPVIRGLVSAHGHQVVVYDDSAEVLDWVGRERFHEVASKGSPCPDHLPHVKHWPCIVQWRPEDGVKNLADAVRSAIDGFVEKYTAYFEENKSEGDKMLNPMPRVILIPGLGMFACGQDIKLARISQEIYHRAIPVLTGAEALGGFIPLTDAQAFSIEYWPLELYKATLRPAPKRSAGRVALVTGGGSGIGRETALTLAREDCHVVVCDFNSEKADAVATEINTLAKGRAIAADGDVGDEQVVVDSFNAAILAFGGVDYVVNNAGVTRASTLADITSSHISYHTNPMLNGFIWVAKTAEKLWARQDCGGAMTLTTSKNGEQATPGALVYNSLKALQIHMGRCLAIELAGLGVRVNCVNPDAVIQGSAIWHEPDESGKTWAAQRAGTAGVDVKDIGDVYRDKSLLKVEVLPGNVADTIAFALSDLASCTTGHVFCVDAGNTFNKK